MHMPIIILPKPKPKPKPDAEPEPRRPPEPFRVTRAQLADPEWCHQNNRRRSEALRAGVLEIVD
jgi:hypothetical protein